VVNSAKLASKMTIAMLNQDYWCIN